VNSRPLRFGITFLRQDNWDRVVAQVERYEAMGLDSAWVADHFVSPGIRLDPGWKPGHCWAAWLLAHGASSSERWSAM
jgi:alkanesulfonate monooxygenase SsuD/methylene tetrahydromethanopterin reductase-like flavin-dependent oxidoreductase (luciferase family)